MFEQLKVRLFIAGLMSLRIFLIVTFNVLAILATPFILYFLIWFFTAEFR
jgi:hypothetical protein